MQICYIIYYIYFYMKYIITSTKMKRIVQIFEQCLFTYNQSANNSDPLNETELPFQLNRLGCGSIHICCHFLLFEIISEKKKSSGQAQMSENQKYQDILSWMRQITLLSSVGLVTYEYRFMESLEKEVKFHEKQFNFTIRHIDESWWHYHIKLIKSSWHTLNR